MSDFAAALLDQQKRLDGLLDRTERLIAQRRSSARDADRVDFKFVGEIVFSQEDTTAQDVVFTIPENQDFVAERLGLYPSFRFTTTDPASNGPNEISFRPAFFSFYEGIVGTAFVLNKPILDCFIYISETYVDPNGREVNRAYQNLPTPVELMYSGGVNVGGEGGQFLAIPGLPQPDPYYCNFEFPMALLFDVDYMLPAGASWTCRIAPNFAPARVDPVTAGGDPTEQNEYRIQVVLEGYKLVRR